MKDAYCSCSWLCSQYCLREDTIQLADILLHWVQQNLQGTAAAAAVKVMPGSSGVTSNIQRAVSTAECWRTPRPPSRAPLHGSSRVPSSPPPLRARAILGLARQKPHRAGMQLTFSGVCEKPVVLPTASLLFAPAECPASSLNRFAAATLTVALSSSSKPMRVVSTPRPAASRCETLQGRERGGRGGKQHTVRTWT